VGWRRRSKDKTSGVSWRRGSGETSCMQHRIVGNIKTGKERGGFLLRVGEGKKNPKIGKEKRQIRYRDLGRVVHNVFYGKL